MDNPVWQKMKDMAELGFNQSEIAIRFGYSRAAVSKILKRPGYRPENISKYTPFVIRARRNGSNYNGLEALAKAVGHPTQQEFARLIGVQQSTLLRYWRADGKEPTDYIMHKLMALDVDVQAILYEAVEE